MKIAFVVGQFPVLSETFILNQIVGLIECGHEVDIYALGTAKVDSSKVHPNVEKYRLLDRTYHTLEIPVNRFLRLLKGLMLLSANGYKDPSVWLGSLNVFKHGKQAASLKLLYTVIPLLGRGPYDIVHCQFGTLGLRAMKMRKLGVLNGKLITSFRGYDISKYLKQCGDNVYNQLFNTGDFFLTNCEYFKRRLVKLGCEQRKLVVHRSGLDGSKFVFTSRRLHPNGRIQIATTGRLVEKKV